jgi:hypothetical protein
MRRPMRVSIVGRDCFMAFLVRKRRDTRRAAGAPSTPFSPCAREGVPARQAGHGYGIAAMRSISTRQPGTRNPSSPRGRGGARRRTPSTPRRRPRSVRGQS